MKQSSKIIFFGTEHFSGPTLERLIDDGYEIEYAITKPDSKKGRNQLFVPLVKQIAERYSIKVLQPVDLKDVIPTVKETGVDFAVLVAYGRIIPDAVLEIFEAIINVHPSLLPKYRGASPIEQAILNGDKKTGISIMQLSSEMDAGDVYAQKQFQLDGQETKPQLYGKLAEAGADFLSKTLPDILSGSLKPLPQQGEPTYAPMIKKQDGVIDWNKDAEIIEKEIRAYLGWPGSRSVFNGQEIIITKAVVVDAEGQTGQADIIENSLIFYCKNQAIEVLRLTPAGRKNMSTEEFLRGL